MRFCENENENLEDKEQENHLAIPELTSSIKTFFQSPLRNVMMSLLHVIYNNIYPSFNMILIACIFMVNFSFSFHRNCSTQWLKCY